MIIAIPRETAPGEARVAATPQSVKRLRELGFSVVVEKGAGTRASFTDEAYIEAGAEVREDIKQCLEGAGLVLKVQAPTDEELALIPEGATLVAFLKPAQNAELLQKLADKKINALAVESIPRISRAQKMDALSSMANIAGYRAVIEAAHNFGRFFTGQITAAGRIPPAKVLVIGAGVAGLSAIGTAKSMGAVVRAFDTRAEVREQVESMGAEFLTVDIEEEGSGTGGYAKEMSKEFIEAEMALFREQAKEVDIVITTALIPGKPAPKLWLADMVDSMAEGSVVVDLAAEMGGNCDYTVADEKVVKNGVTIIGYTNLPSRAATQSSSLYATNLAHLLSDLTPEKNGEININFDDEVIRGATVVKSGEITWPPPPPKITAQPKPVEKKPEPQVAVEAEKPKKKSPLSILAFWAVAGALLLWLGRVAPAEFVSHFTVFVLSIFVGWQVIWNVTHALHTPLMSVTNAISGIVIVGALLQVGATGSWLVTLLAFVGVLVASINIFGGFFVTYRMLKMFRR
ncbi:Re/Si-specific NAD(P)(+) transhydrogenase subunit alpha [Microbulbifer thermotolerans]|uniref:NAD(P) transhydrogenase subunit alpha n=1 Tax=Microbulbifer thermotolerans TaxID=252514 RepID=A0AB35I0W0_MICTH|nr:Re/Si-specific NAD(P)(+) transhydrogenase subunit alpha [Microbulbifer thermotolerans]MCX2783958.1 Re/Si-specific NAD(P)(+) transhydrogenase subunit alpha [Microbulbifer thermotolerans]MCX2793479.1 Re/Si-specific NAD(P)(+) transhydrogenase subunit alpha [Microbulbifer thermotolerans]MCX2802672.1 Re/Si-specific NAD(P)(+) transhydrogenase subunit alpha [Microbulbifer thermotolerans]MCX2840662.1 Re/Si-specific NAD(P)(+) transhydrogenase subunit alpha [Microbulbifer thermotolerans]WKT61341.1 Re